MQYKDLVSYIDSLYSTYPIITAEDYIRTTNIKEFCPVIETSVAMFIKIFLEIKHPLHVLELGTSIGYSSTIIASTIKKWGGRLVTIDIDKKVVDVARNNFNKYDVSESIETRVENATEYLQRCEKKYDFIFLDLYKDLYPDIFGDCLRVLKSDGILIADDTLFPVIKKDDDNFKKANEKLDLFNRAVVNNKTIDSVLLPFGDGITLLTKK